MPKLQVNDGGVIRTLKDIQVNDNGVIRSLKKIQVNDNGVIRDIYTYTPPNIPLGSVPIGDVVKVMYNNAYTEFLVVQHGKPSSVYDASFDNATVLLMLDMQETMKWHSSNVNDYQNSTINKTNLATYLGRFSAAMRSRIKTVKIPYRPGSGTSKTVSSGSSGLSVQTFLLSMTEVGCDVTYQPIEGAKMSYFVSGDAAGSSKRTAKGRLGANEPWWLRTPQTAAATNVHAITASGSYNNSGYTCTGYVYYLRPAIVLPQDTVVNSNREVVI